MASGKASKRRRAAAQAPPGPGARGRPTRADRRIWIAAAAAAAIALAVAIGIVSTRGGDDDVTAGSTLPDAAERRSSAASLSGASPSAAPPHP